jgi:hypothetical protein
MKNDNTNKTNTHTTREGWLRAATNALRPIFAKHSPKYILPEKMRFSIGFTSGGKRGMEGESWHPEYSADGHFEVLIRADRDDPVEILGILVHELVSTLLPREAKHGKAYRDIALRIGLIGKMTHASPGPVLLEQLKAIAADLGPLPHARLDVAAGSNRPKKRGAKYLKVECGATCGYTHRVIPKWAKVGLPVCPVDPAHGRLHCALLDDETDEMAQQSGDEPAHPDASV